jgi:aspartate oxidase
VLRRLSEAELRTILDSGVWPTDFDEYETLLRLGREAGHSVRWVDSIGDSSLLSIITDLARQRPGIRVSELAELLEIDFETAATLSEQASLSQGVSINRDDEPWK